MRWRVAWESAASAPARPALLRDQELPDDGQLSPRIGALVDEALDRYVALADPRGVLALADPEAFLRVYAGEGRNDARSPLADIVPRADALALFVCTVGSRVTAAITDLFARNEPALAYLLDAVASLAADGLAEAAGRELLVRLDASGGLARGASVLPYSPGYCGWHITGQRALFAALEPGVIGVTLNASCLMQPLKSVSGVLVVAPAAAHAFAPDYPCCEACTTHACERRRGQVLRSHFFHDLTPTIGPRRDGRGQVLRSHFSHDLTPAIGPRGRARPVARSVAAGPRSTPRRHLRRWRGQVGTGDPRWTRS